MLIRFRTALLVFAFIFGFYLPSSVAGVISRELTVVAILGTCAILAVMVALPAGLASPLSVASGVGVLAVLSCASMLSPFAQYSPGVVFIYIAIALLYMVNIQGVVSRRGVLAAFTLMNAISLALGVAIVARFQPVHDVLKSYYSAFYPELVPNMLGAFAISKPVLTFATHSMAGFMVYVLGYLSLLAYERDGRWLGLVAASAYLGLLILLSSTSSIILGAVLAGQLTWVLVRRFPSLAWFIPGAVAVAVVIAVTMAGLTLTGVVTTVQDAVLGDQIVGLRARYSETGLLAEDIRYLSLHPLRPIGFTSSESLYLGDSGLAVNLMRGSLPVMLAVYGGLYVFFRHNIHDVRTARWLWLVTVAFEIGFTPLQYFRFVAALPLLVAYANIMTASTPAAPALATAAQ
jgi:hypothetical protein